MAVGSCVQDLIRIWSECSCETVIRNWICFKIQILAWFTLTFLQNTYVTNTNMKKKQSFKTFQISIPHKAVHEIRDGHRSLSGTISCVTDRIRFLAVTMTGSFLKLYSISYTEDRHKLRVRHKVPTAGHDVRHCEIFMPGAARKSLFSPIVPILD